MIRVTCPNCGAQLSAKEELAGQSRKCPKCKTAISIPLPEPPPEEETIPLDECEVTVAHVVPPAEASAPERAASPTPAQGDAQQVGLPQQDVPERLNRQNHYLICDKAHLIATWENNGQGWMLKTSFGLVQANRNFEQLPAQGDFKLVELKLHMTDGGLQLVGIRTYQLGQRYALTTLDKADDLIVGKIASPGFLNRDQKHVVRRLIRDQFMRHVWEHSDEVLDYLGNTDYHSSGVG